MAAEALPWRKSINEMTESDMEAAQQLIQLSDEDNNSSSSNNINRKRNRTCDDDDNEVDQGIVSAVTTSSNKVQQVFGGKKKRRSRYRSLLNIYMATTPIPMDAGKGTKATSV